MKEQRRFCSAASLRIKLDSEDEGTVTQTSVTLYQSTRRNIRTTSRLYSSVTASLDLSRLLYYQVYVTWHCERPHFIEYPGISYINWAYLGHYTDYATGSTAEESWFGSWQGRDNFFFSRLSEPSVGPTQLLVYWVPATFRLGLKRSGLEFFLLSFNTEVRTVGGIPPFTHMRFWLIQGAVFTFN